nr:hypothetical protein [Escherichia coli]
MPYKEPVSEYHPCSSRIKSLFQLCIVFPLPFLIRLTFNAQRHAGKYFRRASGIGFPLHKDNRNTAGGIFWRIRTLFLSSVSCSVTEYASSASSLTEYFTPTCSTRYRHPFSRTGHSFYRQILNTESPPATRSPSGPVRLIRGFPTQTV